MCVMEADVMALAGAVAGTGGRQAGRQKPCLGSGVL